MDHPRSFCSSALMIQCANPFKQFTSRQSEIEEAVINVLRSGEYILGKQLNLLETEFASYISSPFAIGVANGTDAIELTLKAFGIGHGDDVITVSHTAVASVAAIEATGANPVLVDVDENFYTLNPLQLNDVLTPRTKAVLAVHLYGQSCDLDTLQEFCNKNNLYLIEDVSQATGGEWGGRKLGSIGDAGCFSCYPTKNLGAIGDAGLITTKYLAISEKLRELRQYGWKKRYISEISGRNSRLDEIQAAILRVKLKYLDQDNSLRKLAASTYANELNGFGLDLVLPRTHVNASHVFHLYAVRSPYRESLIKALNDEDIFPGIHYPMPIHLQPAYLNKIRISSNLKKTELISSQIFSLPLYPEITALEISKICKIIKTTLIQINCKHD